MSYVLIIGAKSDIAMAIARKYADKGFNLYLAARNSNKLEDFSKDLSIRTSQDIECIELNVLDFDSHKFFYDNLKIKPIGVIFIAGYLGSQYDAGSNFNEARKIIDTNYTGAVSILNIVANDFEKHKEGFIVGISSVAGDRGRGSNYLYGSSKAAFTSYLSGLRNRLHSSNISVLTVKPGYVKTSMTDEMSLPKNLTTNPRNVADAIYWAQNNKKDIIYIKKMWKLIMLIVKILPEWVFKRMSL
jgi:decaprenylphospho-beta-D-erythro-pentofuranosid-2-ulose 2-reductase